MILSTCLLLHTPCLLFNYGIDIYKNKNNHRNLIIWNEYCKCDSMEKFMMEHDPNNDDIMNIFVLIIYTLHLFRQIGIQHNDLHSENILIYQNDSNLPISININNRHTINSKTYVVNTFYIPIIFDFDQTVKYKTNNSKIMICNPRLTKDVSKYGLNYTEKYYGNKDCLQFICYFLK